MKLITVKEATKKINVTDMTVRNWVKEDKLTPYEDDKGNLLVDKRELLELQPTIINFHNQKGGVSKTDTCVITADHFEKVFEKKYKKNKNVLKKILVIDLDPQATLSYMYFNDKQLYGENGDKPTLYNFFENSTPLSKIVRKYNDFIDVMPSHIDLMSKNTSYDTTELLPLKDEFNSFFKKYSIVIIDSPPAINSLSRFGILLSNYILCPLIATDNCYRASDKAIKNISITAPHNKDYIATRYFVTALSKKNLNVNEIVISKYKKDLKDSLFKCTVPDFVGIPERETIKENIFDRYKENHNSIIRLKEFYKELENLIYNLR